MTSTGCRVSFAVLLAFFAGGGLFPTLANAATFTVSTTADSGPGSLRQAIVDANASGGSDTIEFDIPTSDPGFDTQWWTITLASALPVLTGATEIRGFTQTANRGDTNAGVVGTGGTVGVDAVALPTYDRPEIAIRGLTSFDGLTIGGAASDTLIEGVAIYNCRQGVVAQAGAATNRRLQRLLVGTLPDGSNPGAARNTQHGVIVSNGGELSVDRCYVGYNGRVGIVSEASSSVVHVTYSEVFGNSWASDSHDGIDINGIDSEVRYNLSRDNVDLSMVPIAGAGNGIELGSQTPGTGGNLIENNTCTGNVTSGIGIRAGSTGNTVRRNVISGNAAGITVSAESQFPTNDTVITENSVFQNAGLGIDLHAGISPATYDGVTLNDPGDVDAGSNDLQNFPILTEALITGGTLVLSGFSSAGASIEIFVVDTDPSGFGEGVTYVSTVVEGSVDDLDAAVGSYGPVVHGVTVSSAAVTASQFRFSIPLGPVSAGTVLTATETLSDNTSEFGPNITAVAPTPTLTPTPSDTPVPAATDTPTITQTSTPESTATPTNPPVPTATATPVHTPTSTPAGPICGNAVVDPPEECDDGPLNDDTTPDACRTNCTLPGCNDGVPDTPVVDFVLVIETSISMRNDLRRLRTTLGDLPSEFALAGADFRIAVVRYATGRLKHGPDFPEVLQDFTTSTPVYQAAIDTLLTKITGPTEAGTEAFDLALDDLVFRPNAIPVFLLFTDEDDDLPVSIERGGRREPPGAKWLTSTRRAQFQARLDEVSDRLIARKARVAMVINRRNKPSEFQFGSPRATVLNLGVYDQAATLANLQTMQMQDSIQGQLLSAGTCTAGTCTAGKLGFACSVNEDCGLPARSYEIREARGTNLAAFFAALRADLIGMGSCAP